MVELLIKAPHQCPVAIIEVSFSMLVGLVGVPFHTLLTLLELSSNAWEDTYLYQQNKYVKEE